MMIDHLRPMQWSYAPINLGFANTRLELFRKKQLAQKIRVTSNLSQDQPD